MRYRGTTKLGSGAALEGCQVVVRDGRAFVEYEQRFARPSVEFESAFDFGAAVRDGLLVAVQVRQAAAPKPMPAPAPAPAPAPRERAVPVPEKEDADYEEMDDGGFRCLHCGKVYRPGPKAEEYIQKHVAREHR